MSDLSDKILSAAPPDPDARRIERQLRHIDRALAGETDEGKRAFLHASYQALSWARSPDAFAPPVQMIAHQ